MAQNQNKNINNNGATTSQSTTRIWPAQINQKNQLQSSSAVNNGAEMNKTSASQQQLVGAGGSRALNIVTTSTPQAHAQNIQIQGNSQLSQQKQVMQQNQKKLLKSYQVMMSSTKNGTKGQPVAPTTNTNLLLAAAQAASAANSQQNHTQPSLAVQATSGTGTGAGAGSTTLLQQKRISGSQQQIQAAITSKLQSQKLRKQAAQQNNLNNQSQQASQHQSTTNTASITSSHQVIQISQQQQQQPQQILMATSTHKNLKVKDHQTNFQAQQRPTTATLQKTQSVVTQAPSTRGSRSKDISNQQHKNTKQSLNNELSNLCSKPNDTEVLVAAATAASGTKAKSGGVRNTNFVQGLVGTPSATQRVTTAAASALSNKKPQYVGKYQLQEIVGRGAFGRVYKGLNTQTSEVVAIKMIPLIRLKTDFRKSIVDEIDLMKKLDHKNIVKYIETVQSGHQLCIVLEFIEGGSLEYLYKKFGCFSETLVAIYIKQVLKGLEYLHRQTVIHRDIKGGNILTTKDGVVKLADFGVATKLTDAEKNNSFAGTPHWMAPEVIEMSGNLTSASDIWSVGCTVYELLKGSPPNYDLNKFCAMIRNVREPMPIPDVVSAELRDFLQKCFMKDPSKRPSASELMEHSWFKQLEKNKLARLLQKQSLPQEVTNTIKVHLDSQEDELPGKGANISSITAEETQQKVKNVAKMLTRQNINMQPQSQPSLPIKSQQVLPAFTTDRQLKIQPVTTPAPNELQQNSSQHVYKHPDQNTSADLQNCHFSEDFLQVFQHPIIYSQAKSNGVQTTVNLKKAIQDKLSAQALKTTKGQDLQKAKSSLATKNHLSQMTVMNQNSQTHQHQTIKESTTNRANSASQRKVVELKGSMTDTGQQAALLAQKFHPASTTNQSLNHMISTSENVKQQQQQQQHGPVLTSMHVARQANRPQTSLGVTTSNNQGVANAAALHTSLQASSFIDNTILTGVQSSSNMAGSQTTTAAQQQRTGGALFDLRGNKRLFHLSRKMIGNTTTIPINAQISTSSKIVTKTTIDKDKKNSDNVINTVSKVITRNNNEANNETSQYQNIVRIPESQLITEYSPDQDPRLQAPHTSAAQEQRSHQAHQNNTAEKHSNQLNNVIQLKNPGRGLKHSMTEDHVNVGLGDNNMQSHPNFFKQWTEQTELTANLVHGAGHNKLEHHSPPQGEPQYHQFDQEMHHLAHNEEHDSEEDSPAHKLAKQAEMPRKPNWPIKIYQQNQQQTQPPQIPTKSLILTADQLNKSQENQNNQRQNQQRQGQQQSQKQLSSDFSDNYQNPQHQQPTSQQSTSYYQTMNKGQQQPAMASQMQNQQQQNHQLVVEDQQQSERNKLVSYSDEKHRLIDATRRNAMSSLSQNYPSTQKQNSNNPNQNQSMKKGLGLVPPSQAITNQGVSLTATGHYPHSTMNANTGVGGHPQHKSLGATTSTNKIKNSSQYHPHVSSGVMHTAKASQKQTRLRSPLAGNEYNYHQHTTTVDAMFGGGATNNNSKNVVDENINDRDESDLGDLDGDDDTSRTLFQQFVTRTNLGLNRKPSNTTSLSGTNLLPSKKGIGAMPGQSQSTRDRKGGYHQPGQHSSLTANSKQPQEVKQQIKRAGEAGMKQAALIKRKTFLLETVMSGDAHLMQVIVANSAHSCCSSSAGEEDDNVLADSDEDEGKFRHHQCERNQFQKTPALLVTELCSLLKAVTNGDIWPMSFVSGNFSGMDDFDQGQFSHVINDAFKEAFLSQLSYSDIIELLDMVFENDTTPITDSIAYSTLQLINQLAEGNQNIQRQFFAAGLIQKLKEFTSLQQRREVKVEVAYFIGQVFQHSKELIGIYMGCQGFQIQLDFIQLARPEQFAENFDLIMIAIDSILVMFEECPSQNRQGNNQSALSHSQISQQQIASGNGNKRHSQSPNTAAPSGAASMSDRDLAKTLTKAGLMEPLARQIPNFLQMAELSVFNNSPESKESQNALMYLERIFDIFINLAICGQFTVRKELCSNKVMSANLTQVVYSLATSNQTQSPIRYQISKWYVKLIIALTSQQVPQQTSSLPFSASLQDVNASLEGSSEIVIFELLGQRNVVSVLAHLVPLYVHHHQTNPSADANYLASLSLYETLKLLNLLAKMSPLRCEQACHSGQIVLAIHSLISYLEGIGQANNTGGAIISRSKKCRLVNASLQLLHELVVACLSTRTALLDHEIPALLLQLFHLKASSCYSSTAHSQNKSHGAQSLSLQSANNNLRMINAAANLSNPGAAAQDQETVSRILDIFVLWVQQDDQTGQIMQEIVANQQSLEVIFSLISQPRRQKSGALFAFFNALTRILLASDRVIEALLHHVHLIVHLSAILVFLSEHLARTINPHYTTAEHTATHTTNQSQMQGGQTGATPLSRRENNNIEAQQDQSQIALVQHQGRLATQWRDCFNNNNAAQEDGAKQHHHGGSHEHLHTQSRLRSQDRTRGTTSGLMMAAAMEGQAAAVGILGMQQTTQILKELLEIFQLLVQAQHQVVLSQTTTTNSNNFMVQLDLRKTIEQVLKIASDANLVILQSMSSQLLSQINEHLSVTWQSQQIYSEFKHQFTEL